MEKTENIKYVYITLPSICALAPDGQSRIATFWGSGATTASNPGKDIRNSHTTTKADATTHTSSQANREICNSHTGGITNHDRVRDAGKEKGPEERGRGAKDPPE